MRDRISWAARKPIGCTGILGSATVAGSSRSASFVAGTNGVSDVALVGQGQERAALDLRSGWPSRPRDSVGPST